jgi:hypothetical protein
LAKESLNTGTENYQLWSYNALGEAQ